MVVVGWIGERTKFKVLLMLDDGALGMLRSLCEMTDCLAGALASAKTEITVWFLGLLSDLSGAEVVFEMSLVLFRME